MRFWKDRWMHLSKKLRIGLVLLAVGVTAVVSLSIFLACYHRWDYLSQFQERSAPATVRLISEERTSAGTRREIHVKTESGIVFRAAVRIPEGEGPFLSNGLPRWVPHR